MKKLCREELLNIRFMVYQGFRDYFFVKNNRQFCTEDKLLPESEEILVEILFRSIERFSKSFLCFFHSEWNYENIKNIKHKLKKIFIEIEKIELTGEQVFVELIDALMSFHPVWAGLRPELFPEKSKVNDMYIAKYGDSVRKLFFFLDVMEAGYHEVRYPVEKPFTGTLGTKYASIPIFIQSNFLEDVGKVSQILLSRFPKEIYFYLFEIYSFTHVEESYDIIFRNSFKPLHEAAVKELNYLFRK